MKSILCAAVAALSLWVYPAFADTPTPAPQPPPATLAPPVPTAPAAPQPAVTSAPIVQSTPLSVTQEQGPSQQISQPQLPPTVSTSTEPSTGPAVAPTHAVAGPAPIPTPAPLSPPPVDTAPPASTPDSSIVSTLSQGTTISASAPAQLRCAGKKYPVSAPFLSSPYAGWTDMNSFLDHDFPDYRVDGQIIVANGLEANAANGQESDLFPAYWSDALRQYINYDGHNGYDFGISYQPVLAAAAGTVEYAGWNDSSSEGFGYGQMVLINHHNGYVTLYGHLSQLEVQTGDTVSAGQEIGISGTTGNSSGPHLHFSVFHNCLVTDPYGWTGSGKDPLKAFDGEQSTYLWLPGHEPLVLNPPPNWPAYPSGLSVASLPPAPAGPAPAVDRLLLLRVPPPMRQDLTPGVALARTDALLTAEEQVLQPALRRLRSEGRLTNFQYLPAAGAYWIRGSADAATLEALPGVASLAGVQPKDLNAAEASVAHGILTQIGSREAPSLWPVQFRSVLHAFRFEVATVLNEAMVAGVALPGQHVSVAVRRGTDMVGSATATADSQSGGFVATVHSPSDQPLRVRVGDSVVVAAGGRSQTVPVVPLSVQTSGRRVTGSTTSASISLTVTGTAVWHRVIPMEHSRLFHVSIPSRPAGSLVVATLVDGAGNEEAASTFVPGLQFVLGSPDVHGWAAPGRVEVRLVRGRTRIVNLVRPAPDGQFNLHLERRAVAIPVEPNDAIELVMGRRIRLVTAPALHVWSNLQGSQITVAGPRSVTFSCCGDRRLVVSPGAHWNRASLGDLRAGLSATLATGDIVSTPVDPRRVVVHLGSGRVTGRTLPFEGVQVRIDSAAGTAAAATRSSATGWFDVQLRNGSGPFVITPGDTLTVGIAGKSSSVPLPPLAVTRHGKHPDIRTLPRATLDVTLGGVSTRVRADASGHLRLSGRREVRSATPLALRLRTGLVVEVLSVKGR